MNLIIALTSSLSFIFLIGIGLGIAKFRDDIKRQDLEFVFEEEQ